MLSIAANRFNGEKVPMPGGIGISNVLILAEVISTIGIGVILALAATGVLPHYAYVAAPGGILLLSSFTDYRLAFLITYKKMTKPLSLPEPIIKTVKNKFSQEELKGDFYLLPNEILLHILRQLSPKEMVPLTQVNSLLYTWIYSETSFKAFNFCSLVKKQIDKLRKNYHVASNLSAICSVFIAIMVSWDLELAKKMVVNLQPSLDPFSFAAAKLDIFQAEPSEENLEQFLKANQIYLEHHNFASDILRKHDEAQVWINIYKIQPTKENYDKAQEHIQQSQDLSLEAQLDINKIKEKIAKENFNEYYHNRIWFEIIKIEAKNNNLEEAERDISNFKTKKTTYRDDFVKFILNAWIVLYKIKPKIEYLDKAKAVCKDSTHGSFFYNWYEICKIEPNEDNLNKLITYLPSALGTHKWCKIIKIAAKYNIDKAKEYLANYYSHRNNWPAIYIVEEEAKANLGAAFKTAMSIHSLGCRVSALVIIARVLQDLELKKDPTVFLSIALERNL